MSIATTAPVALRATTSIPALVQAPDPALTFPAVSTIQQFAPEPMHGRVLVPAAVQCGAIICLDRLISSSCWGLILADLKLIANALGVSHFVSRASTVAPYFEPNASPPNHRYHLLNACRVAQTAHGRWPQFIFAIIPDRDTWQVVHHLGLMEHGVNVQCVYGHLLLNLNPSIPTRIPALARALSRLNAKLGGCNTLPLKIYDPMYHTLILGVAMAPVRGRNSTVTSHCAIVAAVDYSKHHWYTTTYIQVAQTHRMIHIDTMLNYILDMIHDSIARVLVVRAEIPPDDLEFVVGYETDQIKNLMSTRCNMEPRVAYAVPWDSDHDASSAEDYETVTIGSNPFAVPFNDFGGGWDLAAIGKYLNSLTFDLALDNRPTEWPAPLKYAAAAASSTQIHYISGAPKTLYKPLQGYKTLPRIVASSPYWL
ncbi:hypothetical protein AURDEDRAFT_117534 [Auricularia subglabra TFB-10046 SS5]|uniref:Piwi domain-containing protein n=1 Tax=Auricularia subglabra (strain TFB-10046 / SS5) TaxID=717982 RepID=J0CWD3_AURST|nr:hypothetical protein AURDEDRAFT_117534 [Auricularia subglabra TFB-10046 SS5]